MSPVQPIVAVFGSSASTPQSAEYADGVSCGTLLAEAGFAVATGGYGGLMEAVSEGASRAGGRVIGVTAPTVFPGRSGVNRYVDEEWPAPSLTKRIHSLLGDAAAVIALPGSLGTATELLTAWNVAFVAPLSGAPRIPVVAVGRRWAGILDRLAVDLDADRSPVTTVDSVPEAVAVVVAAQQRRSL
jgi:uncharacterized protein (TIGR00725 family)